MGITNFYKLIDPISPPISEPTYFDSILIDCQHFLYVAIEHSLETEENQLFQEICKSTWIQLYTLLKKFVSYKCASKELKVILAFDGEGVPMKWPTQRARRQTKTHSKKSFYRYVLFGNNALANCVQTYLLKKLKWFNYTLTVILVGCNVPGEGEHKIFHMAESSFTGCQNPIVISVDHDVFILSFLRLNRYKTVQIYRYSQFYDITSLPSLLPYPMKRFIDITFLFGNDFIPPLVGITESNVSKIHNALTFDEEGDVPAVLAKFLHRMRKHIRFIQMESIQRLLIVCFWINYFWILDYYTRRQFPQLFLENRLYDAFDRNQILTALMDEEYSRNTYCEAKCTYEDMRTQSIPHAETHIFTDQTLLTQLKAYWKESQNNLSSVLRITSSHSTKRKPKQSRPTDSETPPKKIKIETG